MRGLGVGSSENESCLWDRCLSRRQVHGKRAVRFRFASQCARVTRCRFDNSRAFACVCVAWALQEKVATVAARQGFERSRPEALHSGPDASHGGAAKLAPRWRVGCHSEEAPYGDRTHDHTLTKPAELRRRGCCAATCGGTYTGPLLGGRATARGVNRAPNCSGSGTQCAQRMAAET